MQVVDPHIHFWNPARLAYPWLESPGENFLGDYSALNRRHEPADFHADAGDIEVVKVVHVEAVAADAIAETRWLQDLADRPENHGFPQGIVAMVDLASADAEAVLATHAAFANVRGIRQILNVHPDPIYDYVSRDYMDEAAWRRNFGFLRDYGLSFDLQVYPSQMQQAAALARDNPDTSIVVNHAGMFVDRDRVPAFVAWRDGMRALAACANVSVKISGLGMFDHRWTVESFRPYVLEAIDAFGIGRAMFASNFPVDSLFSSYADLWRAYADIIAGASTDEKQSLYRANAERIYRI